LAAARGEVPEDGEAHGRNVRTIANRAVNADPGDAPQRRGAHHQAAREGDVRLAAGVDDDHRTCRCPCDREMDSESPG
jgi:hypothetical protein